MPHSYVKMPIGQTRLAYAVIICIPVAIFMYMATVNLHWLNLARVGYLALGVAAGSILAVYETRLVLSRLSGNQEATVWEIIPVGAAIFGVPLLAVYLLFGASEVAPFGLFAFFPLMICLFGVSGYIYSNYEKTNQVYLFVFPYGLKYWTEPNPKADDRLRYFLQDVASKDTSLLWSHIGYPSRFLRELSKRQEIGDTQTRTAIEQLLKLMRKTQIRMLTHFGLTMVVTAAFMAWLFSGMAGPSRNSSDMLDIVMPLFFAVWVSLAVHLYGSMWWLKKKAAVFMADIDSQKILAI